MKTIYFKINIEHGLHARPAGKLVEIARRFKSTSIIISKGEKSANAESIFALMGLGIKPGDTITCMVEGPDEDIVVEELISCFSELEA